MSFDRASFYAPVPGYDPRSWERGPGSIGCRSAPLTGLTAASIIDRDLFRGCYLKRDLKTDQTMTFLHVSLSEVFHTRHESLANFTDFQVKIKILEYYNFFYTKD